MAKAHWLEDGSFYPKIEVYMTLTLALERIGLSKQHQDFWGVQIEEVIKNYNHELD